MAGNLKIRTLGNWSLGITAVLAILCIAMSILGFRKYEVLQSSTRDYIACEAAAQRLQTGSDTLTRQVWLAAATGEQTYIDAYFEEANVTRSRETALADLSALHGGEDAKSEIAGDVDAALAVFTDTLTVRQQRAADVFARIFRTITVCVVLFAAVMLLECMVIRRGIVHPLLE